METCISLHYTCCSTFTLRGEPSEINVNLQQKLPAAKLSVVCTVYKQWLYVIGDLWLQLELKICCKNTGYYSIFELLLLLLFNNYQYNCNITISSESDPMFRNTKMMIHTSLGRGRKVWKKCVCFYTCENVNNYGWLQNLLNMSLFWPDITAI